MLTSPIKELKSNTSTAAATEVSSSNARKNGNRKNLPVSTELFDSISEWFRTISPEIPMNSEDRLTIYGLFKQAKFGPPPSSFKRPSNPLDLRGKAKWDSWNRAAHLSIDEARQAYLDFIFNKIEDYLNALEIRQMQEAGIFIPAPLPKSNQKSSTIQSTAAAAHSPDQESTSPLSNTIAAAVAASSSKSDDGHESSSGSEMFRRRKESQTRARRKHLGIMWLPLYDSFRATALGEREGTSFYIEDDEDDDDDEDGADSDTEDHAESNVTTSFRKSLSTTERERFPKIASIPSRHARTMSAPPIPAMLPSNNHQKGVSIDRTLLFQQAQSTLDRISDLESDLDEILLTTPTTSSVPSPERPSLLTLESGNEKSDSLSFLLPSHNNDINTSNANTLRLDTKSLSPLQRKSIKTADSDNSSWLSFASLHTTTNNPYPRRISSHADNANNEDDSPSPISPVEQVVKKNNNISKSDFSGVLRQLLIKVLKGLSIISVLALILYFVRMRLGASRRSRGNRENVSRTFIKNLLLNTLLRR